MPTYKPPAHAKPLDLRSPFLKVKRAKDHIRYLGELRVRFLKSNIYFGVPKFDHKTNRTNFAIGDVPEVDSDIRLLLGDVAHNLRTALDHVASELAHSVSTADAMVYFPISESEKVYKAESGGKTKGIPQEARDVIDFIGPYGGHDNLLWGLHELDRIDKHRLLLAITSKTQAWGIRLDPANTTYGFTFIPALKAGDIIGSVEGNHESDQQMSVTADIAFGEPQVFAGEALFPTLPIIAGHVERIIGMFGPNPL